MTERVRVLALLDERIARYEQSVAADPGGKHPTTLGALAVLRLVRRDVAEGRAA